MIFIGQNENSRRRFNILSNFMVAELIETSFMVAELIETNVLYLWNMAIVGKLIIRICETR